MRRVLVYDVTEDRRRTRLFKRLQRWLTPVQRSVFEGERAPLSDLHALVHAELDLRVDDVRVYSLCRGCAARVEHWGVAVPISDPDVPIVV